MLLSNQGFEGYREGTISAGHRLAKKGRHITSIVYHMI